MTHTAQALNALRCEGFKLAMEQGQFKHPLLDEAGQPVDPRKHGFSDTHTGGGCEALVLVLGDFKLMITCDGGDTIPTPADWATSLIGVYHISGDSEEIALLTGLEWQEMINALQARP